jgi:hypothetical protein
VKVEYSKYEFKILYFIIVIDNFEFHELSTNVHYVNSVSVLSFKVSVIGFSFKNDL